MVYQEELDNFYLEKNLPCWCNWCKYFKYLGTSFLSDQFDISAFDP